MSSWLDQYGREAEGKQSDRYRCARQSPRATSRSPAADDYGEGEEIRRRDPGKAPVGWLAISGFLGLLALLEFVTTGSKHGLLVLVVNLIFIACILGTRQD